MKTFFIFLFIIAISYAHKNLIIGGDFSTNPWQRGTSVSGINGTSEGVQYVADRFGWFYKGTGSVTMFKMKDAPAVSQSDVFSQHSLAVTVNTATSVPTGELYHIRYAIEGYDFSRIAQRYSTLSFWVKSTQAGTYAVSLQNQYKNISFISEYQIQYPNTWQKIIVSIPPNPSDGSWNYENGAGVWIYFTLGIGSMVLNIFHYLIFFQ